MSLLTTTGTFYYHQIARDLLVLQSNSKCTLRTYWHRSTNTFGGGSSPQSKKRRADLGLVHPNDCIHCITVQPGGKTFGLVLAQLAPNTDKIRNSQKNKSSASLRVKMWRFQPQSRHRRTDHNQTNQELVFC